MVLHEYYQKVFCHVFTSYLLFPLLKGYIYIYIYI